MDTTTIPNALTGIGKLMTLKGQIATLLTERDCKMRKGMPQVRKRALFQCRVGVDYNNIAAVKEGRENGTLPAEPQPLSWGRWMEGLFPYVIVHTPKGETEERHYFRCTSIDSKFIPKVQYLLNGENITDERAKELCLGSEFSEKESEVFVVKVESILEINNIPV